MRADRIEAWSLVGLVLHRVHLPRNVVAGRRRIDLAVTFDDRDTGVITTPNRRDRQLDHRLQRLLGRTLGLQLTSDLRDRFGEAVLRRSAHPSNHRSAQIPVRPASLRTPLARAARSKSGTCEALAPGPPTRPRWNRGKCATPRNGDPEGLEAGDRARNGSTPPEQHTRPNPSVTPLGPRSPRALHRSGMRSSYTLLGGALAAAQPSRTKRPTTPAVGRNLRETAAKTEKTRTRVTPRERRKALQIRHTREARQHN
jgi:hypothetical protein